VMVVTLIAVTRRGIMKYLLTSAGISNDSIRNALVDLLGKPIAESSALVIPTAAYAMRSGGLAYAYRLIHGVAHNPFCELGWKSLGVLELTALPTIKNRKYVASTTLQKLDWNNSTLLQGDVVQAIQQLKQQDGPVLQVSGSSHFLQTLLSHDLVDELYLYICPITLGIGKRVFGEGTIAAAFSLRDVKASPRGVVIATYERAGDVQTG
jgi:dihydrofolate reductase